MTLLEHALQTAEFAEAAGAAVSRVTVSPLHNVAHFPAIVRSVALTA